MLQPSRWATSRPHPGHSSRSGGLTFLYESPSKLPPGSRPMRNHSTCRSSSPWPSRFDRKPPSCQRGQSRRPGRCRTSPSGWSSRPPARLNKNSSSRPAVSRSPAAQQPPDRPPSRCPPLPTRWQHLTGPSRLPLRRFRQQPCRPERPASPQRSPVSGVPVRRCCLSDLPLGNHPAPTALSYQRHSPSLHPHRGRDDRPSPWTVQPPTRRLRYSPKQPSLHRSKPATRQPFDRLRSAPGPAASLLGHRAG